MAAECGHNLQISLGKTRSAPTCMDGMMTSHVAMKNHVTPEGRGWIAKQHFLQNLREMIVKNDCKPTIGYAVL